MEPSEVDQWWAGDHQGKFPGSTALFVGAGISIPAPTSLPGGADLTHELLRHLLSDGAAEEILTAFAECAPVLGRSLPRLEHVLEKTCNPIDYEGFSRAGNPKDLLALFSNRIPNNSHHLIARHLLQHKGWCITTNFDDCIERAASFAIPVHVIDPQGGQKRVLHSEHGTDWGLIKLHGTIEEGVDRLWATLADLQFGLPDVMRRLLNDVMQKVDAFIVAGYSGTDHFDVNHWIRERTNARPVVGTPKLIWISHAEERSTAPAVDDKTQPYALWSSAFLGTITPRGPTTGMLSDLLGIEVQAAASAPEQPKSSLKQALAKLYQPGSAEIHLNGARLAASIGLGQRAGEELQILRHLLDDNEAAASIEPDIYFVRGMRREALAIRANLDRVGTSRGTVARTRMLRQQGRRLAAISRLLLKGGKNREPSACAEDAIDALACGLDIVQDLQQSWMFRTQTARRMTEILINGLSNRVPSFADSLPIELQGKLQTQELRQLALFSDHDEKEPLLGRLWRMVHEQQSPPSLYVASGPLIPGYFLIEQSTAREQDRLTDLVHINLELAEILLCALRRRWPKGIQEVKREYDRKGVYAAQGDFHTGTICTTVLFQLLFDCSRIATALREHGLQVSIAACWLKAERLLGGVAYWMPQRLYLPRRKPRPGNAESSQTNAQA